MAERDDTRTEQATAKRKAESRKKGQVPVSREVPTAAVLLGGIGLLWLLSGPAAAGLLDVMRRWLSLATEQGGRQSVTADLFQDLLLTFAVDTLSLSLPFIACVTAIGAASYVAQTGFLWNSEGLQMDPGRLNPVAGLGRFFSLRAVVELLKSILKISVIAWAGFAAVQDDLPGLPGLVQYDLWGALSVTVWLAFKVALAIALTVAVLSAADYAYQRFEWERSLRMSKQEIKQEQRETEGDPLLRARVRSLQREMARNRMMAAVPKADVVITNPTHLAVALRYDQASMAAPVVVAKGAGYVAQRIKDVANEHGVTVIENQLVARSLYKLVEIGQEIPSDLYRAVAEILALVYRAKGRGIVG
ncbi:MAG: flagellar biosynthesis protein FlhB [Nitrospirota bacterium]